MVATNAVKIGEDPDHNSVRGGGAWDDVTCIGGRGRASYISILCEGRL